MLSKMQVSDLNQKRAKINDISRWAWCQEEAYWRLQGITRPEAVTDVEGQQIHRKIRDQQPENVKAVFKKLFSFWPYVRILDGINIFGHVDGFDGEALREGKISVIEVKSTGKGTVSTSGLAVAKMQVSLYAWLLEPYVHKLGYTLNLVHFVDTVDKKTGALIERSNIFVDPKKAEEELRACLQSLKKGTGLRGAKEEQPWKCEMCAEVFKSKCRFWQGST